MLLAWWRPKASEELLVTHHSFLLLLLTPGIGIGPSPRLPVRSAVCSVLLLSPSGEFPIYAIVLFISLSLSLSLQSLSFTYSLGVMSPGERSLSRFYVVLSNSFL